MQKMKRQLRIVKTVTLKLTLILVGFWPQLSLASSAKAFVIVANAPLQQPFEKDLLKRATHIVALDGAAIPLMKQGTIPNVIVGDMDSFTGLGQRDIPPSVRMVKAHNQNKTDLEKGIEFCDQQGAQSITILNALGGRMDHTLWNIQLLKKYYKPERPLLLINEEQSLSFHKNEIVHVSGKRGDNCGVFGAPSATVSSEGLTYNMKKQRLLYGSSGSVSNSLSSSKASITIEGEAIVIKPLAD